MISVYEVGKKFCEPGREGCFFDLTDTGANLILKFRNPTPNERRAVKSGVAQFRFAVVDDIIFFLSRFGTLNWMDAPYNAYLSRISAESWEDSAYKHFLGQPEGGIPGETKGLALFVALVDSNTGILAAQRLIGLSTEFSSRLIWAVAAQPEIPDYHACLARVMREYPTSRLLDISVAQS